MKYPNRSWLLAGLAVAVVLGLIFLAMPTDKKLSFIGADIAKDHSRFTPTESVDVAMAMKMVTHEPPHMLHPPSEMPVLLLYPPSEDDLAKLTGS